MSPILLLNAVSGRVLREGDSVRILTGDNSGKMGKVVGFDIINEASPIVVQRGNIRENAATNDLEVVYESPESLEPLPEVDALLVEGNIANTYLTCGKMICLTLLEDGTIITFVPRDSRVSLRKIFEKKYRISMRDAIDEVSKHAFVTRRPHLTLDKAAVEVLG
jgi:hypothetical protein